MAKVKPFNPGQGLTPRSKGDFITLATPNGYVAQKWPKKRGPPKTPYDLWRQKEFAWVANAVSSPFALDYGTAVEMVKGTTYVPRDFLMMCAYGNAYEIRNQDGTIWQRYRDVTNNPQYMLEQLTSTPGAIIYRGTDLWTWLGPGNEGYVLTMENQRPVWKAPPAGGGAGSLVTVLRRTSDQVDGSSTLHTCTWQEAIIDEIGIWDPANPTRLYMPPDINRIRVSWQMLSPSRTFNQFLKWELRDNTGSKDWFGAANLNPYQPDASIPWTFNFSAQGPWAPDPGITYCELKMVPSTSMPWTFGTNTSITIEYVPV